MEENIELKKDLRRLEDVLDTLEQKICNTVGIIELIRMGIERLYKQDDSNEISSLYVLGEYLLTIQNKEITNMRNILTRIKEQI